MHPLPAPQGRSMDPLHPAKRKHEVKASAMRRRDKSQQAQGRVPKPVCSTLHHSQPRAVDIPGVQPPASPRRWLPAQQLLTARPGCAAAAPAPPCSLHWHRIDPASVRGKDGTARPGTLSCPNPSGAGCSQHVPAPCPGAHLPPGQLGTAPAPLGCFPLLHPVPVSPPPPVAAG